MNFSRRVVTFGLSLVLLLGMVFSFAPAFAQDEVLPEVATPEAVTDESGKDLLGTVLGGNSFSQNNILHEDNKGEYGWVETMWVYTRRLTNFAIIIFFFIAAASNVLNIKVAEYGVKKTLPSVIVAGLLANFSYAISQAALNVNEALTNVFTGTGSGPTQQLEIFKGYVKVPLEALKQNLNGDVGPSVTGFLGLIVVGIIAVAMLFMFALFFVRNVVLAMLVVLAPLAFICMAFPATQSVFSKWLSEASKWVFLPAIAAFWLFLGATALTLGIASGGVWIAMMFAGIVVFMAIRTPFMLGAFVGTAAGWIAARASQGGRLAGSGVNASTKGLQARAKLGYEKSFVGRGLRARRQGVERLEKRLNARRSGKAWNSLGQDAPGWKRLLGGLENVFARNVAADEASVEIFEGDIRTNDEEAKRQAYAANPELAQRVAQQKMQGEDIEAELNRMRGKAELEERKANAALSLRIAKNQEAASSFEESISGITQLYKSQALATDSELRKLKKLAEMRKQLGDTSYRREMGKIKQEIREGDGELSAEMKQEIDMAMGQDHYDNEAKHDIPPARIMARTLARLSGETQDVESMIEEMQKTDLARAEERKAGVVDAMGKIGGIVIERSDGTKYVLGKHNVDNNDQFTQDLVDHDFVTQDADGAYAFADTDRGKRMQIIAKGLGVDHLGIDGQISAIREYTSGNREEFRRLQRRTALASMGKARASGVALMERDLSEEQAIGLMQGRDKELARAMVSRSRPGASHPDKVALRLTDTEEALDHDIEDRSVLSGFEGITNKFIEDNRYSGNQFQNGFNQYMEAVQGGLYQIDQSEVGRGIHTSVGHVRGTFEALPVEMPGVVIQGDRTVRNVIKLLENNHRFVDENGKEVTPITVTNAVRQAIRKRLSEQYGIQRGMDTASGTIDNKPPPKPVEDEYATDDEHIEL